MKLLIIFPILNKIKGRTVVTLKSGRGRMISFKPHESFISVAKKVTKWFIMQSHKTRRICNSQKIFMIIFFIHFFKIIVFFYLQDVFAFDIFMRRRVGVVYHTTTFKTLMVLRYNTPIPIKCR